MLKVRGRWEETARCAKCPGEELISVALPSARHGSGHCHPCKDSSLMSEQDTARKAREGPHPGVQADKRKQQ